MANDKEMLAEWAFHYIKNKDLLHRKIEKIEKNRDSWDIVATEKDFARHYIVEPVLGDFGRIEKMFGTGFVAVVTLNTKENLNSVIKKWDSLKDFQKLSIIFVNPKSDLEKKWVLHPFTHDRITDKSSLKKGLMSMFQSVEQWS